MNDQNFLMTTLILWLILISGFCYFVVKWKNHKKAIIWGMIVNFCFLLLTAYLWFYFIAVDGVSQVFGVFLYIVVFIIVEAAALLWLTKKAK